MLIRIIRVNFYLTKAINVSFNESIKKYEIIKRFRYNISIKNKIKYKLTAKYKDLTRRNTSWLIS